MVNPTATRITAWLDDQYALGYRGDHDTVIAALRTAVNQCTNDGPTPGPQHILEAIANELLARGHDLHI